jgi:hypothetical protein
MGLVAYLVRCLVFQDLSSMARFLLLHSKTDARTFDSLVILEVVCSVALVVNRCELVMSRDKVTYNLTPESFEVAVKVVSGEPSQ